MSSCFTSAGETLWMSNGAAQVHVEQWHAAVVRSERRGEASGLALRGFFTRHLESAGPGMYGFDFDDEPLLEAGVHALLSAVVAEVAQRIVDAAAEADGVASLEFMRKQPPVGRAHWCAWERVLGRWVSEDTSLVLEIPQPLDSASRAFELLARIRAELGRPGARGPTEAEAELRREACDLLVGVADFVGPAHVRDELLALADLEDALGHPGEAVARTRAAARFWDDPVERERALEIAAQRDADRSERA